MRRVLVPKDWPLARQTPGRTGQWGELEVVQQPVRACDYVVVLNRPSWPVDVLCPPANVWALVLEPANEYYRPLHAGDRAAARVYTTDDSRTGDRFRLTYPPLPWQVRRSYDELKSAQLPEKRRGLSCVTSAKSAFAGHRRRLDFLVRLGPSVPFDLFGRGFRAVEDKWDALAPYRYSLAIENHVSDHYWTEKIADCFLAWTMPVYYGATRITDYFPQEAMVAIDIEGHDALDQVREAVAGDRWRKNLDAIEHARSLVLDRWQLFPFLAGEIEQAEAAAHDARRPERVVLSTRLRLPPTARAEFLARRGWTKTLRALSAPLVRRTARALRRRAA